MSLEERVFRRLHAARVDQIAKDQRGIAATLLARLRHRPRYDSLIFFAGSAIAEDEQGVVALRRDARRERKRRSESNPSSVSHVTKLLCYSLRLLGNAMQSQRTQHCLTTGAGCRPAIEYAPRSHPPDATCLA